ncbi:uncharacterized protein LOC135808577 [Sycon ciliatum]|uniref:uncharacterized protein LOC135808577 n=1 Tax=Sycon ciliatum TaxID=27933 RepID=UPI0031F6DECD
MNVPGLESFPRALVALETLAAELGHVVGSLAVTCESLGNCGGSYGELRRLILTDRESGKEVLRLVVKTISETEHKLMISRVIGLAREAVFFSSIAKDFHQCIGLPKVYYSEGDVVTGRKVIIMEELSNVTQSGYFFGPGSPLNRDKDLSALVENAGSPPLKDVIKATFASAARLHAKYWMDESLLEHSWLRGAAWLQDSGKEQWKGSQQVAADSWKKFQDKLERGEKCTVDWPDDLRAIVSASVSKISWETFSTCGRPWTLVHGDFHPANMMWCHDALSSRPGGTADGEGKRKVVLLDWELVGLGSGPQDIGQYMISHMEPVTRKQHEEELVRYYYDELMAAARPDDSRLSAYTWDECWQEYITGAVGRWMWFLAYFSSHGNDAMQEFFVGQVGTFMHDHGITADTVCQPRS